MILVPTPINTPGTIFQSITTAISKEVPYCTEPLETLPNCDSIIPSTPVSSSSSVDSGHRTVIPETPTSSNTNALPMPSNDNSAPISTAPPADSKKSNYKVS